MEQVFFDATSPLTPLAAMNTDWTPRDVRFAAFGTALACTLGLLTVGCVPDDGPRGRDDDGGWVLDNDTGVEPDGEPSDTATIPPDGGERRLRPKTFRLTNDTGGTLRIQRSKNCQANPPAWLSVDAPGEGTAMVSDCGLCTCTDLESGRGCAVCGKPCRVSEVVELGAGESADWKWSGHVYPRDQVRGRSCQRQVVPPADARFEAEFCWSAKSGPTGPDNELEDPSCQTVTFRYGDAGPVIEKKVEADTPPTPQKTVFELKNATNTQISVQKPTNCRETGTPWVSLQDGKTEVDFGTDCTRCTCEQIKNGDACAVCSKVCTPGTRKQVDAGDTLRLQWDGVGFRRSSVDGRSCQKRWVPEIGDKITAKFCWIVPDPRAFVGSQCETVTFRYGQDTVRAEATSHVDYKPHPAEIRLENGSQNEQIYVQAIGDCRPNPPGWLEIRRNDKAVPVTGTCATCACDQIESAMGCGVCDLACAAPTVRQLKPGQQVTWTWPGHTFPRDEVDGRTCYRKNVPKPGEQFDVRLCWGRTVMRGPGGGSRLANPTCTTRTLTYGQSQPVVHKVP